MREFVDRRVLGGFRCLDAITNRSVLEPLSVISTQLKIRPNRSGVYALFDGPGLRNLTTQFHAPPAWPAATAFEITVQDPAHRYMPRRKQILAPQALPILSPQPVLLYPAAAVPLAPNWAVVRAAVMSGATPPAAIPWAVVQVVNAGKVLATGVTNRQGEALLAVPGLGWQVSASGAGAVTEVTTAVSVTALVDPSRVSPPAHWISNPDDILQNISSSSWKSGSQAAQIAPGQTVFVSIAVPI